MVFLHGFTTPYPLVYYHGMEKVEHNDGKWREKLTPEQYRVLREKGTEAPFTGKYVAHKEQGMYRCAACGAELFSSAAKYDSGTGWPSFIKPAQAGSVKTRPDATLGMERTEVICPHCGSHLGHVFDDGPKALPDGKLATGKRYCINSCALDFNPEEPAL